MRSRNQWTDTFLAKLGFARKRRKNRAKNGFSRPLRVEGLEDRRMLAVLTVNTHLDELSFVGGSSPSGSPLSLREAIELINEGGTGGFSLSSSEQAQINTTTGGLFGANDTILFSGLTSSTIQLDGSFGLPSDLGQLRIERSVIIDGGSGPNSLTIRAFNDTPGTPIDRMTNDGDGGGIFHVYDANSSNIIDVTLRDMTLTGADIGYFSSLGGGGAIRLFNESLTVENLIVRDNACDHPQGGGGIYAEMIDGAHLTVVNSDFSENYASGGNGGAIHLDMSGGGGVQVGSTQFVDNLAYLDGGAIAICFLDSDGSFDLSGSVVRDNHAGYEGFDHGVGSTRSGGGLFAQIGDAENFKISRCQFSDNSATANGGAIRLDATSSNLVIQDCTLNDNLTGFGNLLPLNGNPETFGNVGGGGAYIDVAFGATAELVNMTVSNNRALSGGGLYLHGDVRVRHSTIAYNTAGPFEDEIYSGGGGVQIVTHVQDTEPETTPSFDHSIIAYNTHLRSDLGDPVPSEPDPDTDGNDPQNYSPNLGEFLVFPSFADGGPPSPGHFYGRWPYYLPIELNEDIPYDSINFDYTIVSDLAGPFWCW